VQTADICYGYGVFEVDFLRSSLDHSQAPAYCRLLYTFILYCAGNEAILKICKSAT